MGYRDTVLGVVGDRLTAAGGLAVYHGLLPDVAPDVPDEAAGFEILADAGLGQWDGLRRELSVVVHVRVRQPIARYGNEPDVLEAAIARIVRAVEIDRTMEGLGELVRGTFDRVPRESTREPAAAWLRWTLFLSAEWRDV